MTLWRRFRGWPWWVQGLLVLLVIAVIGGAASSGGGKKSPRTTTSSSSNITGFGATDSAWNGSHTADTHYAPGAAYNPDPSLPKSAGDDYAAVQHENGHVLSYEYRFKDKPISAARADVLRTQFPADAKVAWFTAKRTCAQMMVTSASLAKALGGKAIGDTHGSALVEFSSGVAENSYDPKAVNDALFLLLPLEPKRKAPGC